MLEELSLRLSRIVEQKMLKKKLEQDLASVEAELQEKSAQFAALETQLKKEQIDVEKLEGTSLTAMFYSVLGNREQQLEKERQELLSAQLRFQKEKHQVEFLQREQETLQERLHLLAGIEAEYEMLLSEKEALLRQSNQILGKELLAFSEQTAKLKSEEKEVMEAIAAGNDVLAVLDKVIESLESAEGWGTWDILGGGVLSTAMKHSRIDEAHRDINEVQAMMSRFRRELADVQKQVDLEIDIDRFTAFADYFFDGLIVDWIVQSKIADSLARSKKAKLVTASALQELEEFRIYLQDKHDRLQEQRAHLIERA